MNLRMNFRENIEMGAHIVLVALAAFLLPGLVVIRLLGLQ
jgi:hypothetical protein